jgi:hypothetical protein
MKKLLILMLVLGITSTASAVLTWSVSTVDVEPGASIVVQLVSSDADPFDPKWVGQEPSGIAEITSILALPAATPDSIVLDPTATGYAGWWTVNTLDLNPPSDIIAGAQYDVTITAGMTADVSTAFDSDSYGTNDVLTVNVIPEPMTIALLGLGGLFLLRRRK